MFKEWHNFRLLLLLFLLFSACQQDEEQSFAPYWRVSHQGNSNILLGTMHSVVDVSELPAELFQEIEDASVVTIEAEVRYIDSHRFTDAITLADGELIENHVTDQQWANITETFQDLYTPNVLNTLQPWYLEGALVRNHLPEVETIDIGIINRADAAAVPATFLETWQYQVSLLNGLGLDDGLGVLLATISDLDGTIEVYHRWASAYRSGDVELLEDLAFAPETMKERPRFYEEIVFQRNSDWIDQLEPQFEQGGAFVAVGFMHMLTEQGLVHRLRERGFEVELVERGELSRD